MIPVESKGAGTYLSSLGIGIYATSQIKNFVDCPPELSTSTSAAMVIRGSLYTYVYSVLINLETQGIYTRYADTATWIKQL